MKKFKKGALGILIGSGVGLGFGIWLVNLLPQIIKLDEHKNLQTGEVIPSFSAHTSETRIKLRPAFPEGKFHFYLVSEDLPKNVCFDLECGQESNEITKFGGHVIGIKDFKWARSLGVDMIHDGDDWRLEHSLLVITNENAVIHAMFKHAQMKDLPKLLKKYLGS